MIVTEPRKHTLKTKHNLRLALTPAMRQSLHLMAWRNHQIMSFARDLIADNPFLDIHYPELPVQRHDDLPSDFPFSSAMALDRPDKSLHEHLMTEIGFLFPMGLSRSVAMALLPHITPSGWLDKDAADTASQFGIGGDAFERLVEQLQSIEPVGLFARNLTECLTLQLRDRGLYDANMKLLLPHLPILMDKGVSGLEQVTGLDADIIKNLLHHLRQLDPKPGAKFMADDGDIYHPDLIITENETGYEVAVNAATLPSISVTADIENDAALKPVLKKARAEAAALKSALSARANLLTTLTGFAITRQSQFMKEGEEKLVPLTMMEAASHLGCHPSTVTRLVKDKLVSTPRGIIPLSHFFSTTISRGDGTMVASRAVTATIISLITDEDKLKPLSDNKIADAIFRHFGVQLTSRAIAKHRAKCNIAKASERRIH